MRPRLDRMQFARRKDHVISRRVVICAILTGGTISIAMIIIGRSFFNTTFTITNDYFSYSSSSCSGNYRKKKKIGRGVESNVTTATLQSYSYSTCPFTMSKFSLHELSLSSSSSDNSSMSQATKHSKANMQEIAKQSLNLSNNAKSYQRVLHALQNGAFSNRRIILDGDSLTRQLFISLSCMAWSAGYVTDYTISKYDVWSGGENPTLRSFNYTASERFYKQVHVKLKDDGDIYYIDYFNHAASNDMKRFGNILHSMVRSACNNGSSSSGLLKWSRSSNNRYYKARYSLNKQDSPMILNKDDVVVVSAGHHDKIRPMYLEGYKQFFQCMQQQRIEHASSPSSSSSSQWPHFFYQLSSVQGFNTIDGEYTSQPLPGKDKLACRTEGGSTRLQQEDRDYLDGLVPFIADTIDLTNMGNYHIGGGDCTHWVQPGGEFSFTSI